MLPLPSDFRRTLGQLEIALKDPLTAISFSAEEVHESSRDPETRRYMEIVLHEVERIAKTLKAARKQNDFSLEDDIR